MATREQNLLDLYDTYTDLEKADARREVSTLLREYRARLPIALAQAQAIMDRMETLRQFVITNGGDFASAEMTDLAAARNDIIDLSVAYANNQPGVTASR